jgi:hypothetical protein
VQRSHEENITEEELDPNDAVNLKFLQNQFKKCFKVAPDERFV